VLLTCATLSWVEGPPRRRVDAEVSPLTALPERFLACAGFHLSRGWEIDGCFGAGRGLSSVTSHVFYRKEWFFAGANPERGWLLRLGPGLGVRGMRFCPFAVCAQALGPEGLVSLEAVKWIADRVGITLQADAGLGVVWTVFPDGYVQQLLVPGAIAFGHGLLTGPRPCHSNPVGALFERRSRRF
jgi:hypothetical protein